MSERPQDWARLEERRRRALRKAQPYRIASAILLAAAAVGFLLSWLTGARADLAALSLALFGSVFWVWCVQGRRAGVLPAKGGLLYAEEHPRAFAVAWWVLAVVGVTLLSAAAWLLSFAV